MHLFTLHSGSTKTVSVPTQPLYGGWDMSIKDYTIKVDNKLRGAYGETDTTKRVIRINKKMHKRKNDSSVKKNPDGSVNLLDTIVHEKMHAEHPKMHEKTVRKETRNKIASMSPKAKKRIYNLL